MLSTRRRFMDFCAIKRGFSSAPFKNLNRRSLYGTLGISRYTVHLIMRISRGGTSTWSSMDQWLESTSVCTGGLSMLSTRRWMYGAAFRSILMRGHWDTSYGVPRRICTTCRFGSILSCCKLPNATQQSYIVLNYSSRLKKTVNVSSNAVECIFPTRTVLG